MAEEQNNAQNQQQGNAQPLVIHGQFVKDLSFESPNSPQIFNELSQAPEVDINVDVKAERLENNFFEVNLRFNIVGRLKGKTAFVIDLVYGCVASVNVPQEHLEPMLLIEIPRHLFPFARNIISTATQEGGFPPLLVTPIDFVGLYRQKAEAAQQQQQASEEKKED